MIIIIKIVVVVVNTHLIEYESGEKITTKLKSECYALNFQLLFNYGKWQQNCSANVRCYIITLKIIISFSYLYLNSLTL